MSKPKSWSLCDWCPMYATLDWVCVPMVSRKPVLAYSLCFVPLWGSSLSNSILYLYNQWTTETWSKSKSLSGFAKPIGRNLLKVEGPSFEVFLESKIQESQGIQGWLTSWNSGWWQTPLLLLKLWLDQAPKWGDSAWLVAKYLMPAAAHPEYCLSTEELDASFDAVFYACLSA